MGKKGKNGHKMSPVRKYGKMAVKLLGVGLGSAVALTPLSRAVVRSDGATGAAKFNVFTDAVGNEYLGLQSDGHWNSGKAVQGVGSIIGGMGIMWLFGQLAKRI